MPKKNSQIRIVFVTLTNLIIKLYKKKTLALLKKEQQ